MKKIFIISFLFLLQITNAQNFYKPLEKEPQTDFFILNQKQVEEIFNKEPKNFTIELPTSNLTTKKFNVKPSNFKSKDFKIKDSNGNLIKADKNTIGLIYELFDIQTNENQGIIGIKKNQIDVEIQLKRNYISIHEFDTTRKYKVTFGEIDKAFREIKKKVEDIKYLYASNDNEMVLRDLAKTEESLLLTTFCSRPVITTTKTEYIIGDTLSLSFFRFVSSGSTDDTNLLYYNFIYPNGDTTSVEDFFGDFGVEELNLPVKNNLTTSDIGWYYVKFRQEGCPTMLDSIYINVYDTSTFNRPNRPIATNEFIGNSGGIGCKSLIINFDISYDYYQKCNMDASKAAYKVTYVFNFVKKIFDEIAIPLKLGDIRVSTAPEGLSNLNIINLEGQFNIDRVYCSTAFSKFICNANIPAGFQVCAFPSEFRTDPPEYRLGIFDSGKSILWEWKNLMYTNNSNTSQWEGMNDENPEVTFLVIDKKIFNDDNREFNEFSFLNNGNYYTDIDSYKKTSPYNVSPHINMFSNFRNKVDKYTGCYTRFIGCSQRRGLLLNYIIDHPYFQSFTSQNYKDILKGAGGNDTDPSQGGSVNVGVEGINIASIGILPFFGDSALPTNVTDEKTWKKYIYATDNGNGTVVLPDDAQFRWKTTPPSDIHSSKYIVNNNFYRQINTSYPMFNTLNANAYMLIYNLCNLLGVEAKTSQHKNIYNSILSPLVAVNNIRSISSPDLIARDYTVPPPYQANSSPDFISWDKGFLNHEINYMRGVINYPPTGNLESTNDQIQVPYAKIGTNKKNYVVGDVLNLTTDVGSSSKNFYGQGWEWYTTQDMYDFTNNLPSATIPTTYRWTGPNNYTSTNRENSIALNYGNAPYGGVEFRDYYLQKYYTTYSPFINPPNVTTCSSNVAKIRIKIYPFVTIPVTQNLNDWVDLNTVSGNKKFRWALRNWDFIGPFSGTDFETDYLDSRRSGGGGLITRKFGTFNTLNEPNFTSGTGWTNPRGLNNTITWNGLAYQARNHPYQRNEMVSDPNRFEWPNDAYDGWYARSYDISNITLYPYADNDYIYEVGNDGISNPSEFTIGPVNRNDGNKAFRDMNQQYGGSRVTVRYPTLAGYDYWRKGKADTARSPIYIHTNNTNPVTENGLAMVFNISHAIGQYSHSKVMQRTQLPFTWNPGGQVYDIDDYDSGPPGSSISAVAAANGQIDGQWNSGHLIGEYQYNYTGVPTPDMYDSLMIYAYFSGGTTPRLVFKKSSKELATIPAQTGYKREFIPAPILNNAEWRLETIDLVDYDTCSRVQFDFVYKNGNSIYSASNNLYIRNIIIGRNIVKRPALVADSSLIPYDENNVVGITKCDSIATWTVNLAANHNANQIFIERLERNASNVWQVVGTVATFTIQNQTAAFSASFNLRYKNFMINGQRGSVYFRAVARNVTFGSTSASAIGRLDPICNVGQIKRPNIEYITGYTSGGYRIFSDGTGSIKFILPANHRGKYFRLYGRTTSGFSSSLEWKAYNDITPLPNYNTREIKINFGITSNEPYTINLPTLSISQGPVINAEYEYYLYLFNTPQFADFTLCCSSIPTNPNPQGGNPPNGIGGSLEPTANFPYYYNYSTIANIKACTGGNLNCLFPPDVTGDPAESTTGDFTIKIQYKTDHAAIKYLLYESTTSNSLGNAIASAGIPNQNFPFLFTRQILGKPNGVYYYKVETKYANGQISYSMPLSVKVNNPNTVSCAPINIQVINNTRAKFEYKFTLSNNCPVPEGYKAIFYKCNNSNTGLLATNPNLNIEQVKQLPLGIGVPRNIGNDVTDNIKLAPLEISQNFFQRTVIPKLSAGNSWYKIDVICTKCATANKITTIYTYVTNN